MELEQKTKTKVAFDREKFLLILPGVTKPIFEA
jgi:hypothetical protein